MKKVGVVGIGIMGSGIVDNFLKNNYEVYIWNRSANKLGSFEQKGATICNSPEDVAENADIIFEVTANDESSRAVWLGENGIFTKPVSSKVYISCATLSTGWVDELANLSKQNDVVFFDMPMTGGRIAAEAGQLTLLVGGSEEELEKVRDTLSAIAKDIKYFGKAGNGARYKLILNGLQATHIAALAEAIAAARSSGLDEDKVGEALCERPGGIVTQLAWDGYNKPPSPINFSVNWIAKDLAYMKQLHDSPILDKVLNVYRDAIDRGHGNDDWTEVTRA